MSGSVEVVKQLDLWEPQLLAMYYFNTSRELHLSMLFARLAFIVRMTRDGLFG